MKKVKQYGHLRITRDSFIETINEIKNQRDHDDRCQKAYGVIFPNDYVPNYDNHWLHNQLVKLLKMSFNDDHRDSWIDYFLYDLDFGKDYNMVSSCDL